MSMISNFVKVSLKDNSIGQIQQNAQSRNSFVLNYPCTKTNACTPYILDVSKGVYQFECWGSIAAQWNAATPGKGGYTSGLLIVNKPTTLYVYIGNIGLFNAVKELKEDNGIGDLPGGATDIRLNTSDNWWDPKTLISRIMVAAGGGGAEWDTSIGGNGGGIEGGESQYIDEETEDKYVCKGASQTNGNDCVTIGSFQAVKGEFGTAGVQTPNSDGSGLGGHGGGGYYGGTSYYYAFAGSGGSSFISGHKECNAVKDQIDPIEHSNQPNHYSGFIFSHTKMIGGNQEMPLPTGLKDKGIHTGKGAFRITLLFYQFQCTFKTRFNLSLIPLLFSLFHNEK